MKRCVIFAGADVADYHFIAQRLQEDDYLVCADSGLKHALRLGVTPHLLVGDFDSFEGALPPQVETILLKSEKDDTDTAHAIEVALQRGYTDFMLFGAVGGRLDHTLANLSAMYSLLCRGCSCLISDQSYEMRMVQNGTLHVVKGPWQYLSVFPYAGDAVGVTLTGVKYPLKKYHMVPQCAIGVSNEVVDDTAGITVEQGTLFIIQN